MVVDVTAIAFGFRWQDFVAPHLPRLRDGFERAWPGLAVRLELGEATLFADVDAGDADPADAAHAVAAYLAPLWPSMLEVHGVDLEVGVAGGTWAWRAGDVSALHRGGSRFEWLAFASFLAPGE